MRGEAWTFTHERVRAARREEPAVVRPGQAFGVEMVYVDPATLATILYFQVVRY